MQVTRRYWATVTLAGLLGVAALVYAEPLLVVGASGLGGWLLSQQLWFLRTATTAQQTLTVTQSVTQSRVPTDETIPLVLQAALPQDSPILESVALEVVAAVPVGASVGSSAATRLSIQKGTPTNTTTIDIEWPVAGEFTIDAPTVTIRDQAGFFRSEFPATVETTPTVTVLPRRPRNVHVGQGGDQVATAFGNTKTGEFGHGVDPGEVREYVPGDTLRQIDWKATARSDGPHVREFEEETDRQTALVVDHRASLATGPAGETKLDYARQVALAFADYAITEREPLGLVTVGDGGLTARHDPNGTPTTASRIQTILHDLTPSDGSPGDAPHQRAAAVTASPRVASRTADRLRATDSQFASQLHPFFDRTQTYLRRMTDQPLYNTVRTQLPTSNGSLSTVLITDDQHRAEVRETTKLAQTQSSEVLVFLTPTVLFEHGSFADLETAYTRYREFEEFRQTLARRNGVSAFEVAPGDRLDTLLATHADTDVVH